MKVTIGDTDAGARLDKLVVQAVPGLGRAGAKRLFSEGRVRIGPPGGRGRRAAKGDVARSGDLLEIDLGAGEAAAGEAGAAGGARPDPGAALEVMLELPELVVVDKPAGQPTAPLAPGELGTLANALVARYPELAGIGHSPREPGLVHRLDNETSGLVVAARTQGAFEALRDALREGRLDKRYLLVCEAKDLPETGTIEIPLAPHPKDRRRVYPCVHPRDVVRYAPRPATTTYRVVKTSAAEEGGAGPRWALVEARAAKAARHQIRAHFAAIGHPLAGDALYGGPAVPGLTRHALHAHYVAWGGEARAPAFCVQSPLPAELEGLLA